MTARGDASGELDQDYLEVLARTLRGRGIALAPGLTDRQLEAAEAAHGFRFPTDLRAMLAFALPVGRRFPDWRDPNSERIRERLAWPADSLCFDVEHASFWLPAWGRRPDSLAAAKARARDAVRAAPFLIPIYAHRYLPAEPCVPGNPVFSVYQTDIILYGLDLAVYLFHEFGAPNPYPAPAAPRRIAFWSDLEDLDERAQP